MKLTHTDLTRLAELFGWYSTHTSNCQDICWKNCFSDDELTDEQMLDKLREIVGEAQKILDPYLTT